jgi:uncharacterized membrane protein
MRAYLGVSATLFGLIALGHLLRLVFHWPAEIAGRMVPGWVSFVALVVTGVLCAWGLRLGRASRPTV